MELNSVPTQLINSTSQASVGKNANVDPLREKANEFEAVFIKQMLEYAGLGEAFGNGGGATSETFASFVLDRVAADMVEQGGFGMADDIYAQLSAYRESTEVSEKL